MLLILYPYRKIQLLLEEKNRAKAISLLSIASAILWALCFFIEALSRSNFLAVSILVATTGIWITFYSRFIPLWNKREAGKIIVKSLLIGLTITIGNALLIFILTDAVSSPFKNSNESDSTVRDIALLVALIMFYAGIWKLLLKNPKP